MRKTLCLPFSFSHKSHFFLTLSSSFSHFASLSHSSTVRSVASTASCDRRPATAAPRPTPCNRNHRPASRATCPRDRHPYHASPFASPATTPLLRLVYFYLLLNYILNIINYFESVCFELDIDYIY